ncbi:MAG: zf-HC2 domain-containing protein [Armatimonadota bacterium]|nr:zf-HC2 domain-containing protein [Armatimonadota bacterium]MCX7776814.1 zf-HC2 domain-containing protein [Armatimonadota bacterium]MDW8024609.1 zf-HC2 domain-containing protein [Armatimonadota bacterium]
MNCEQMRMLISAYIDGELSDTERDKVEEHLRICDECLNFQNAIVALKYLLASHRLPSPSRDKFAALLQRLRGIAPQRRAHHAHRCSKVQQRMLELIDEKLSDDQAAMLLTEIARCDACTTVLAQWERYASAVAGLASISAPQQRKVELIERLRQERLVKRHGAERVLWRFAIGVLVVGAVAIAFLASLMWQRSEQPRIVAHRIQGMPTDSHRGIKGVHGATAHERQVPSTRSVAPSFKLPQMASVPERPKSVISPRSRAGVMGRKSTALVSVAPAARTSMGESIKPVGAKLGKPAAAEIKREGISVVVSVTRPYKPAEPTTRPEELPTTQMLAARWEDVMLRETPSLESHQFMIAMVAPESQLGEHHKVITQRSQAVSPQKSFPIYGMGIATGEHTDDELYMHGGLREFLRHRRIPSEHELKKLGEASGQQWRMLSGAAFQPRPEIEELERLRERMLGYQTIVEQSRSNDIFMGANQNRLLYLKLFRLGIQW